MTESGSSPIPPGRSGAPRFIDRLLERYETRHHSVTNRAIQFIAIPLLLWSGFALARTFPEPSAMAAVPGLDWAVLAGIVVSLGYAALSWQIGAAMAVISLLLIAIAGFYAGNDTLPLWQPALIFLILGFLLWLVGRRIEGRPRLLGEMAFDLVIGPAWFISKILKFARIGY